MCQERKTNTENIEQIKSYFKEHGSLQLLTEIWEEYFGEIHIMIEGEFREEHEKCKRLMNDLDYLQLFQNVLSVRGNNCIAEHIYRKG